MTDRKNATSKKALPDEVAEKPDPEAELIHDLATAPPAKDMASVKAASDVFEANRKDRKSEQRAQAHG